MKVRKKRNPGKTMKRMLDKTVLWTWDTDDGVLSAMIKTPFQWCEIGENIVRPTLNQLLNWAVCARVLCLYKDGTEKLHTSICSAENVRLNDLMPVFTEMMNELKSSQKQQDIVDAGWIAMVWTKDNPIDDEKWCRWKVGPVNELRRNVYSALVD